MRKLRKRIDELTLMRSWSDWLSTTREGYLTAILQLSPEERQKVRGASRGSIQNVYLHIVGNNKLWLESVPKNRQAEYKEPVGRHTTGPELRRLSQGIVRSARTLMKSMTPRGLDRMYVVRGTHADGKP